VILLNTSTAAPYLCNRTGVNVSQWAIKSLGGGVSNEVLLAEAPGKRWVLKQARPRLRVQEEWLADPARIRREAAALRLFASVLPPGAAPAVVFEDPENYIFAMEAAPADFTDWKSLLLRGVCEPAHAREAARLFRAMVSWRGDGAEFADQHCFDQLRLDPYYRFTASRHRDLSSAFEEAIACCRQGKALVHGDFSPKNLLVASNRIILIDCEVIHWGDPSFDAAFLLNHLLLKMAHGLAGCRALALLFWKEIRDLVDERATLLHLGCLHLARVDGKSPAEYLTGEEREHVRRKARQMIVSPPKTMEEAFQ